MRRALDDAVAHFNDAPTREQYFALYDPGVVLHGYPPGVTSLGDARDFYEAAWAANPGARLEIVGTEARGDLLEARFRYAGHDGVTVLRFGADGRVHERWQATTIAELEQA